MGDYYIPLRSTESPRVFKWARRMFLTGLIALLIVVALTVVNVLPDDTWLFTPCIIAIASGLFLYWEVG